MGIQAVKGKDIMEATRGWVHETLSLVSLLTNNCRFLFCLFVCFFLSLVVELHYEQDSWVSNHVPVLDESRQGGDSRFVPSFGVVSSWQGLVLGGRRGEPTTCLGRLLGPARQPCIVRINPTLPPPPFSCGILNRSGLENGRGH